MPIYEYRRQDGTTFEVLQKFSDPTLTEDPDTGEPITRVFRAPAIHFKGSGFHNTDYGTRKRGKDEGAGDGASGDGKGEGKKDDAKPAKEKSAASSGSDSSSSSSSGGSGSSTS